jgi:dTDP-4-dehydrorhamnose reductase
VASIKEVTWAITGAAGQLGKSLSRLLDDSGNSYVAWGRNDLDITQKAVIEQIEAVRPEILVNCAAWTNVDGAEEHFEEALKINKDGAQNCAIAAKELHIPLFHISTDYVFSGSKKTPWTVQDESNPTSRYGLSKLMGEQSISHLYPEGSRIFRTAWLYGPFGTNFAKRIIKKALSTKDEIKVVHDQKGQPTSTFDLASQLMKARQSSIAAGIYHATNSGDATWWEFATELVRLSGESANRVIPVSSSEFASKVKRPEYSVLDHSQWASSGVAAMRNWKEALQEIYPQIHNAVERELIND